MLGFSNLINIVFKYWGGRGTVFLEPVVSFIVFLEKCFCFFFSCLVVFSEGIRLNQNWKIETS